MISIDIDKVQFEVYFLRSSIPGFIFIRIIYVNNLVIQIS